MKKRAIALIIVSIMIISVFSGCSLFEHNYERDYKQIVATIQPITVEWVKKDADGNPVKDEGGESVKESYTSEVFKVTKRQLFDAYINNTTDFGEATAEQIFENLLNQLLMSHILIVHAKARMQEGTLIVFNKGKDNEVVYKDINDSLTDVNVIWKNTFKVIGNQIFLLGNEILSERNEEERKRAETEDKEPSFPVMPDYDTEEPDEVEDAEEWKPDLILAPEMTDFLYQEACARLVRLVIDRVKDDSTLTKAEKQLVKADEELLKDILKEENGKYKLYFKLKDFFSIKKFIYEDQEDARLIQRLQESIINELDVSDTRIQSKHTSDLINQQNNYVDETAFATALDGTEPVYYYAHGGYYYVKHVLIPFSTEQTAKLKAYTALGYSEAEILRYREGLASEITGFARQDGENYGDAIDFNSIKNEIYSAVDSQSFHYYKEREFDRLMYKYNTDTGIFSKPKGYLVKPTGNNYVPEFQKAAEKLFEDKTVGALSEPVLTEFGYHIMYLSSIVEQGKTFNLYDHQTPAQYKTFYDIIKETFEASDQKTRFSDFTTKLYSILEDEDMVKKYPNRYKDFLK